MRGESSECAGVATRRGAVRGEKKNQRTGTARPSERLDASTSVTRKQRGMYNLSLHQFKIVKD